MTTSAADVPTLHASRYMQQLAKHWTHKMAVTFDTERAEIHFPNGSVARLTAEPEQLHVSLEVPEGEDQARMETVLSDHLDRFAFREAPLRFDWRRS